MSLKEKGTSFFFHAGETDWWGLPSDENLFYAILLDSKRIGHGYAFLKHSVLANIIKQKKIAVEVSPISNQVLKLVDDIRNHPATKLVAENYPIVITSDNVSFWGAKALSYDWYYAFMGLSRRYAELRFLKQLAVNSILFSSTTEEEKNNAFHMWQRDWNIFIDSVLKDYHNN